VTIETLTYGEDSLCCLPNHDYIDRDYLKPSQRAESINATGSIGDKVIITYLNPYYPWNTGLLVQISVTFIHTLHNPPWQSVILTDLVTQESCRKNLIDWNRYAPQTDRNFIYGVSGQFYSRTNLHSTSLADMSNQQHFK